MTKILIVMSGGIIQNILSTDSNVVICKVDYDKFGDTHPDGVDEDGNPVPVIEEPDLFDGNFADTLTDYLTRNEKIVKQQLAVLDAEYPMETTAFGYTVDDIINHVNGGDPHWDEDVDEDVDDDVDEDEYGYGDDDDVLITRVEANRFLNYLLSKGDASRGIGDVELDLHLEMWRQWETDHGEYK